MVLDSPLFNTTVEEKLLYNTIDWLILRACNLVRDAYRLGDRAHCMLYIFV